jgi:hypothetical protein
MTPLHCVQNDFPVVNTPGILDFPVANTLRSLDSPLMNTPGSRLLDVFGTSIGTGFQKKTLGDNRPGSKDLQVY